MCSLKTQEPLFMSSCRNILVALEIFYDFNLVENKILKCT